MVVNTGADTGSDQVVAGTTDPTTVLSGNVGISAASVVTGPKINPAEPDAALRQKIADEHEFLYVGPFDSKGIAIAITPFAADANYYPRENTRMLVSRDGNEIGKEYDYIIGPDAENEPHWNAWSPKEQGLWIACDGEYRAIINAQGGEITGWFLSFRPSASHPGYVECISPDRFEEGETVVDLYMDALTLMPYWEHKGDLYGVAKDGMFKIGTEEHVPYEQIGMNADQFIQMLAWKIATKTTLGNHQD